MENIEKLLDECTESHNERQAKIEKLVQLMQTKSHKLFDSQLDGLIRFFEDLK